MTSAYIHIPFCTSKCFYCSFTVAVGAESKTDEYITAILKEAEQHAGQELCSLYFGGGTPSFLSAAQWEKLLGGLLEKVSLPADAEVTVECNPESVCDHEKFIVFKAHGVNRISLGVQTMNARFLKYLGRNHDGSGARNAYHFIRKHGIDNVSLDFMYGFPGQSSREIELDLAEIAALKPEHVSLYTLDIEPRSRFHTRRVAVSQRQQAEYYTCVNNMLEGLGFEHYEISNYAQPGCASRHNSHYWRGGNYLGLGVGAHGHCDGRRYWNTDRLADYLALIASGKPALQGEELLDSRQRFDEAFLFGLRMAEGVDLDGLSARFGESLSEEQRRRLDEFEKAGYIEKAGAAVKLTSPGKLVLDELCVKLLRV